MVAYDAKSRCHCKENRHFENDRGLAEYIHDEVLKESV